MDICAIVVKRVLRRHGYPPEIQNAAETVVKQAELLWERWTLAACQICCISLTEIRHTAPQYCATVIAHPARSRPCPHLFRNTSGPGKKSTERRAACGKARHPHARPARRIASAGAGLWQRQDSLRHPEAALANDRSGHLRRGGKPVQKTSGIPGAAIDRGRLQPPLSGCSFQCHVCLPRNGSSPGAGSP